MLGFEFGYSVADPLTLVMWEAQFGDFANGAQIMIDQFISCCESKWGQPSGLVMLLPHGYEGQGPEHSSARIERFLQLCAGEQHAGVQLHDAGAVLPPAAPPDVRRQRPPRHAQAADRLHAEEPAAPSARRSRRCRISPAAASARSWATRSVADASRVSRVVFCSGKIYYDLLAAREERKADHVAIVRVEQLYPFAADQARDILARYPLDGGSGVGAGRAAQHGRVALHARADPAAARRHAPRAPLRGPPGKRQPGDRIAASATSRSRRRS